MYEKNIFIALFATHLCLFDQCHDNVIQVFNVSTTLSMSNSLFLHQKEKYFITFSCLKQIWYKAVDCRVQARPCPFIQVLSRFYPNFIQIS